VIPPQYEEASYFSGGRALVKLNGKYGFIDAAGKLVIPATYDEASEFSSGLAAVRVGVKWAFVDKDGKPVGPTKFDWNIGSICGDWNAHEGLRKIVVGGKYGFMDDKGAVVIAPQYECAMGFDEGLAPVKQGGQWGFIDKTGKLVVPFKYFRVDLGFDRGFAYVTVKLPGTGGWLKGFIDRQGNEFFEGPGVP
jgi:hypothetical protein